MKKYLPIFLLLLFPVFAAAQTRTVSQTISSKNIVDDLNFGSGRTFGLLSGSNFNYAAGTNFTGSASEFRSDIGGTTVGQAIFTLTNPGAVTFPRLNADNTVSALNAADFRTALGAGTGAGTVTTLSVVTANGVSGSVANATTTPAVTLTLGAITPTSVNGLTVSTSTGTLTIANSKVFTASNTLSLTGTDGSTLNIGTGGTLASGAYAAAFDPTAPGAIGGGTPAAGTFTTLGGTNLTLSGHLNLAEIAAPATPAAGTVVLYAKTDGEMYYKNDAGTERAVYNAGGGGGGADPVYDEEPGTASVTGVTPGTVLSVAITPSTNTKRIKISAMVHVGASAVNTLVRVHTFRDSTEIGTGTAASARSTATSSTYVDGANAQGWGVVQIPILVVDSPATTSSVTYTIRLSTDNAGTTVYLNRGHTDTDAIYSSRTLSALLVEEIP